MAFGLLGLVSAYHPVESYGEGLTFSGASLPVLSEVPERSTGLDKIYVIYDVRNVDLIYISNSPQSVRIYKYSNLGGGFAEEVEGVIRESDRAVIRNVEGNVGYIIEDADRRYYYWLVNYLPYRFDVKSIGPDASNDCDATNLSVEGVGEAIHFFTINGQQQTLNREISIAYQTQEWDAEAKEYENVESVKYFEYLSPVMRISPAALCATSFHISGDKFLRQWNWLDEAESVVIPPVAVAAMTEAIQEGKNTDGGSQESTRSARRRAEESPEQGENTENGEDTPAGSNEISSADDGLGGSAPAEISFNAYASEGVVHHEWQLSTDPEFEEIDYRFNQQNIDYSFMQEGTFYMRYIGSNSDGSCDVVSDTYTINIGASELKCPNAFSPDGDGVNDEWKVSFRSLLSFKCWIFDRYGAQLFYFDDPTLGWDGKRGGKTVPSGVYYYVIQAEGADGKKYKKSGDINILRHRAGSSTSSGESSE